MIERNAGLPPERRIEFRVGIHLGDVVEESDGDLMGDSVNIAARLEGIADPGGICLSEDAYRQVRDRLKEGFADLGEKELKNIARPVRVFAIKTASSGVTQELIASTPELGGDGLYAQGGACTPRSSRHPCRSGRSPHTVFTRFAADLGGA